MQAKYDPVSQWLLFAVKLVNHALRNRSTSGCVPRPPQHNLIRGLFRGASSYINSSGNAPGLPKKGKLNNWVLAAGPNCYLQQSAEYAVKVQHIVQHPGPCFACDGGPTADELKDIRLKWPTIASHLRKLRTIDLDGALRGLSHECESGKRYVSASSRAMKKDAVEQARALSPWKSLLRRPSRRAAQTTPVSTNNSLVRTAIQRKIMKALEGHALTGDELANKIGCDKTLLYRKGGIKELRKDGSVENDRRVGGYYLPRHPPV
jgi:hypothetical protein